MGSPIDASLSPSTGLSCVASEGSVIVKGEGSGLALAQGCSRGDADGGVRSALAVEGLVAGVGNLVDLERAVQFEDRRSPRASRAVKVTV